MKNPASAPGPVLAAAVLMAGRPPALAQPFTTALAKDRGGSASHPNAMRLHEEQFAMIESLIGVRVQKARHAFHQLRDDLGMVVKLKGHDPALVRRRVGDDVREIAIERNEDRVQFLRPGDDGRVKGTDGQDFAQQRDVMPALAKLVRDFDRDAVVAEEPQAHAAAFSKLARSRAKFRQAVMSAAVRSGNSRRMAAASLPAARYPRIRAAGVRVPLMHGLPLRMSGSVVMWSRQFMDGRLGEAGGGVKPALGAPRPFPLHRAHPMACGLARPHHELPLPQARKNRSARLDEIDTLNPASTHGTRPKPGAHHRHP